MSHLIRAVSILICAGAIGIACSTQRRITNTDATGLEQLLTTEAIDRAIDKLVWPDLSGRTAYIQVGSPADWGDLFYLHQAVTAQLVEHGAAITPDAEKADTIVSVLAGSIGTDEQDVLFGMPEVTNSIFPIALPELALYKAEDQEGFAKLELVASNASDGRVIHHSGPAYGRTFAHTRKILFFGWYSTDTSRREGE